MTKLALLPPSLAWLASVLLLCCVARAEETAMVSGVLAQEVWQELRSRQTVSFSVVRDTAQFLVVNLAWITAGLLLWRGPAVTREVHRSGEEEGEEVIFLHDRLSSNTVDISRLNNFFMNPNKVARNLYVCTSLVGNPKSHKSAGNCSSQYFSS